MSANSLRSLEKPALSLIGAAALALALTGMFINPGAAQETKTGTATIETIAYQPIPPGATLQTQPESESQMDNDAWRQIDADLASRGYAIGGDGNLVVTVATQLVARLSTDQSLGAVNAAKSDPKKANLFSTGGGTLLNPADPINTTDRVFRVNMTVYDRPSGHYVWRGTAERNDAELDPSTAMRAMLPALLDHFGETASGITIPLTE